jgi:hypothetical protein
MKTTIFEKARNKFTTPFCVLEALSNGKKVPQTLIDEAFKDLKFVHSTFNKIEKKFFSDRTVSK